MQLTISLLCNALLFIACIYLLFRERVIIPNSVAYNPDNNLNQVYHLLNEATMVLMQLGDQDAACVILSYIQHNLRSEEPIPKTLKKANEFSNLLCLIEKLDEIHEVLEYLKNKNPENTDYQYMSTIFLYLHKEIRNKYPSTNPSTSDYSDKDLRVPGQGC